MSDTNPPLLVDLQAAALTLDGKAVLRGLTLQSDVRRMAVVGRNGSGKTSLVRLISGLVAPTGGQIRIAGVDVVKDRCAALGLVGILFQNPDHQIIFPTVGEEIGFGLRQMGQTKDEVAENVAAILAQFDKAHWADASVHVLSQGQRQLVCLMAVLAMRPRLILLDEPFAGLDIPTAIHLRRVLARIDANLWVITHDPESVRGFDHAIWIDHGKIVQHGTADDVLDAYQSDMKRIGAGYDLSDIAG